MCMETEGVRLGKEGKRDRVQGEATGTGCHLGGNLLQWKSFLDPMQNPIENSW